MRTNKNLLTTTIIIIFSTIFLFAFASIQGSSRTYDVKPQINMPEYKSDTNRAIDAYERLMERYMDLVEKNISDISRDYKNTNNKLDSIDEKITDLSTRLQRIENALGIEPPIKPTVNKQKIIDNSNQE
jgi:Na+/phosphate symporter